MIKTFFYTEIIGALGLLRGMVASGPSRMAALAAAAIGLLALAAKYIPPIAGLTGTDSGNIAAQIVHMADGMALPLAATCALALSAFLKGRRWWVIDALHVGLAAVFFGLWGYTLL